MIWRVVARSFVVWFIFAGLLSANAQTGGAARTRAPAWPGQMGLRVPFEPTAFPSNGSIHLIYEMELTNRSGKSVTLTCVDVLDAASPDGKPVAHFAGNSLDAIAQFGNGESPKDEAPIALPAGQTLTLFMGVSVPDYEPMPERLTHRVTTAEGTILGAEIGTHHDRLQVLGPPVAGTSWLADDGPGNGRDNHHRRGVLIIDGEPKNSRRYAVDWMLVRDGKTFAGNERAASSYFAFGQPVFAVADGTVVVARDGLPDNPPGHGGQFHPVVPITPDTLGGNTIVVDLGAGQFAHYDHLHQGSLKVKTGEHVRRGAQIAEVGSSGEAFAPHLHFQVTTGVSLLASEGVPYVIDHYRVIANSDRARDVRNHELPLDGMIVEFDGQ